MRLIWSPTSQMLTVPALSLRLARSSGRRAPTQDDQERFKKMNKLTCQVEGATVSISRPDGSRASCSLPWPIVQVLDFAGALQHYAVDAGTWIRRGSIALGVAFVGLVWCIVNVFLLIRGLQ